MKFDPFTIEFDAFAYSVEAIQKAAYRSINVMSVLIRTEHSRITCLCEASHGISDERFELALHEFKKDAIDEELRIKIKRETEDIRNLILGLTFSKTNLQSHE